MRFLTALLAVPYCVAWTPPIFVDTMKEDEVARQDDEPRELQINKFSGPTASPTGELTFAVDQTNQPFLIPSLNYVFFVLLSYRIACSKPFTIPISYWRTDRDGLANRYVEEPNSFCVVCVWSYPLTTLHLSLSHSYITSNGITCAKPQPQCDSNLLAKCRAFSGAHVAPDNQPTSVESAQREFRSIRNTIGIPFRCA